MPTMGGAEAIEKNIALTTYQGDAEFIVRSRRSQTRSSRCTAAGQACRGSARRVYTARRVDRPRARGAHARGAGHEQRETATVIGRTEATVGRTCFTLFTSSTSPIGL
jgi:hypothetical protein